MFVLDSLLVGGLRFVLDKVARVVDQELNDPAALREQLLEARMRLELGEITEEEWLATEREVLARIRELHDQGHDADPGRVVGVDVRMEGDES